MLCLPVLRPICVRTSFQVLPRATMSWESKRDHDAIMTYNKMLKKPVGDTTYPASELRLMKKFFANIREYRRRSEEGFEPPKLFMVWRIADNFMGCPHWEKTLMIELGLIHKKTDYAIVKNTPSMNKKLWTIKHLIRIRPITFPDGFPEEDDYTGTFLKQTGELVIAKRLKVNAELMAKDLELEGKLLKYRDIAEDLRLKWDQHYPKLY